MRLTSLLLLLLPVLPAWAQPELPLPSSVRQRVMIVWGGGRTQEEAAARAEAYQERAGDWSRVLELAPGYPQLVNGTDQPGLRPGYFFVVLGVCDAEQGRELTRAFKALEPLVYSRQALWSESSGLPCPRFVEGWSFSKGTQARVKGGTLAAAAFEHVEGEGPGEYRTWLLVLAVLQRDGAVVSQLVEPPEEGLHSKVKSLQASRGGVVLVEHLLDPDCDGTQPRSELHARSWRFSVQQGAITSKESARKLLERRTCPQAGEEAAEE
jgi:hypothetical protein